MPLAGKVALDRQWTSVEAVAQGRLDAISASRKLQADAGHQLDAAYYSLGRIIEELAPVMRLPEPQRAAVVHTIDPALRRVLRPEREKNRSEAA